MRARVSDLFHLDEPCVGVIHPPGHDFVVSQPNPGKYLLGEHAAVRVRGVAEVVASIAKQIQSPFNTVLQLVSSKPLGADDISRRTQLAGDPQLLSLQLFERHGTGVVRPQKCVALPFERRDGPLRTLNIPVANGKHSIEVLHDLASDDVDLAGGDRHGLPVGLDRFLNEVDRHGALAAAVPQLLPTHAVEVVVQLALTVADDFDAEQLATLTTIDGTLEVVRMQPGLLAALYPTMPNVLDGLPQIFANQRFVFA